MSKLGAGEPRETMDQGEWIKELLKLRRARRALGGRKEPLESQEELYLRTAMEMRASASASQYTERKLSAVGLSTSFDR